MWECSVCSVFPLCLNLSDAISTPLLSFFKVFYIQVWAIHYLILTKKKVLTFNGRPFLHLSPINHLVGVEFRRALRRCWEAGWAAGMKVDSESSGRSVQTV